MTAFQCSRHFRTRLFPRPFLARPEGSGVQTRGGELWRVKLRGGGGQLWRGGTVYSAIDGSRGGHQQCHDGPGGPLI